MKTIEEAAKEYGKKWGEDKSTEYALEEAFELGAEFSQRWLLIEKDKDGFTTNRQQEEIVNNLPFLLKGENEREELYHDFDNDVDKQYYTHWRPLNRK